VLARDERRLRPGHLDVDQDLRHDHPEAVSAALEARVDCDRVRVRRVMRRLTRSIAARLAQAARGRVRCVAVTRHPSQARLTRS